MAVTGLLLTEARFKTTLRPAHDLIKIHKRNPEQGRRVADLSLNKGAVVFAVAAWQVYVQELTEAILVSQAPPPSDPSAGMYRLLAGRLRDQVRRFNTPNAQNSLELFGLAGFDPTPAWGFIFTWEWQYSNRYGSIARQTELLSPRKVKAELDAWDLVRNRIAHGDTLPTDTERVSGTDGGKPQMMRRNADRCVRFFEALVLATGAQVRVTFP